MKNWNTHHFIKCITFTYKIEWLFKWKDETIKDNLSKTNVDKQQTAIKTLNMVSILYLLNLLNLTNKHAFHDILSKI